MKEDIRCLFGQLLSVESDYGMVRLTLGRTTCILMPEAVALLIELLTSSQGEEDDLE